MKNILRPVLTLLTVVVLLLAPLRVVAEGEAELPQAVYSSPIIISEIQTGAGSAGDEFIELYNTSSEAVDLTGWQVRYVNASLVSRDTTLLATISDGTAPMAPHSYFVLQTDSVVLDPNIASQIYASKLSSADKAVALFAPDLQTCEMKVKDAVAWGLSVDGEGTVLPVSGTGERLVRRYRNSAGQYVDTDNNSYDTLAQTVTRDSAKLSVAVGATPGSDNTVAVPANAVMPTAGHPSTLASLPISSCEIPEPDPAGDQLEPPVDSPPAVVEPEAPQPAPVVPTLPTEDTGLSWPQITELLPNPAKPQLDTTDEFVEFYNSNGISFNLTGFILQAGKRKFVFPAGTRLDPHGFKAFFSAETRLSLSNSGGLVALFDPAGNLLVQTEAYSAAKDGQSWSLAAGKWYWTTAPTPNAANVIRQPEAKKKATAKTSAKLTAVKGVSTGRATSKKLDSPQVQPVADVAQRNPLHPGVLALIGGFALLYGAYEYRNDVANKFYQLRSYRAARREARESSKRR